MIYLQKNNKKKTFKIFEIIFLQNLWNYFLQNLWNNFCPKSFKLIFFPKLWNNFPPKSLKLISSKIFETNYLQNLWNKFPPKSLKLISSNIYATNFFQNLWKCFPPKSLKQFSPKSLKHISSKIFETNFLQNLWNNFGRSTNERLGSDHLIWGPMTCPVSQLPTADSRQLHLDLHPLLSWTSLWNKGNLCLVSVLSRVQQSLSVRLKASSQLIAVVSA